MHACVTECTVYMFRANAFNLFFLALFLFDWVGVLWPQLSKVLKSMRCSTSERPSTAKTTQHPDPSIDPQVDPSHPSPHPSFPLCSSDLMSRSKY